MTSYGLLLELIRDGNKQREKTLGVGNAFIRIEESKR